MTRVLQTILVTFAVSLLSLTAAPRSAFGGDSDGFIYLQSVMHQEAKSGWYYYLEYNPTTRVVRIRNSRSDRIVFPEKFDLTQPGELAKAQAAASKMGFSFTLRENLVSEAEN